MFKINIKPLSVNEAWVGRRFKTPKHKAYKEELMLMLPNLKLPPPPYSVIYEFGLSNSRADWDNPVKLLQDTLQERYEFDDKHILEAHVTKVKVDKGKEYIKFEINSLAEPKTAMDVIFGKR